MTTCTRCKGTGIIPFPVRDDWGDVDYWTDGRCPDCDGRGKDTAPHNEEQRLIDYAETRYDDGY